VTRTTVAAGNRTYVVSEDVHLRYQAVAVGRVTSAVAGMPTPAGIVVGAARPGVRTVVRDADFCLAADPRLVFPAAASVDVSIAADGFAPATITVAIDPASLPAAAGTVALRPLPVRVQGRVVDDARSPLQSARVLSIDDPTVGTTPSTHALVFARPLARGHAAAVTVEEAHVASTSAVGTLTATAGPGAQRLELASRTGLVAGTVIGVSALGGGDYAEVAKVVDPGPAPLGAAGTVTLRDPLTQTLAAGAAVDAFAFGGTGASTTLAAAAQAGGAVVVAGAVLSGLVRIEPGADEEYRFVGAPTDSQGYYRLDGIGDVLSLWLAAEAPGFQQGHQAVTVRYGTPVTVVDFQLTP
jgi:hypothetical protein